MGRPAGMEPGSLTAASSETARMRGSIGWIDAVDVRLSLIAGGAAEIDLRRSPP